MDYLPEITHTASLYASLPPSFQVARSMAAADRVDVNVWAETGREEVLHQQRTVSGSASPTRIVVERPLLLPLALFESPLLSPPGVAAAAGTRSVATTAPDADIGAELQLRRVSRRDSIAEDSATEVVGKRKRSVQWVGETAKKVVRRLSALPFRRRSSAEKKKGWRSGSEAPSASPLLPTPSDVEYVEHAAAQGSIGQRSVSPPPDYTSDTVSLSSAHALISPHPEFQSEGSYIDALNAHLWSRHDRGVFDEDRISFRFAGASGNQEDGVSEFFYAGSQIGDWSSRRASVASKGSQEQLLDEIRAYGPLWARGMGLESVEEDVRS